MGRVVRIDYTQRRVSGEWAPVKPRKLSNKYFTVKEVAERLSVSLDYVYDQIRSGKIRAVQLGKRCIRISLEDLETFLNQISPQRVG